MSAPTTRRSTTNRNQRGSSEQRRARRSWLVNTYGDGVTVLCFHCLGELTPDTVSADRIVPGGSYNRPNIRPSCLPCNVSDGGKLGRARQLGTRSQAVKLTPAQMTALIRVRCTPYRWEAFGKRQRPTLEVLARLGLVSWYWRSNGAGMVPVALPVLPLTPEGVTL